MKVLLLRFAGRCSFVLAALIFAFSIIGLLQTDVLASTDPSADRLIFIRPIVLSSVLTIVAWALLRAARAKDFVRPHNKFEIASTGFDIQRLKSSAATLAATLNDAEIKAAMRLSLNFGRFTARITERVILRQGSLGREVDRKVRAASLELSERDALFLPVLRHQKGRLIDQISLKAEGKDIDTLPHDQNVALSLVVLSRLYEQAMRTWKGDRSSCDAMFEQILCLVANPVGQGVKGWTPEAVAKLQAEWFKGQGQHLTQTQRTFARFAGYLCEFYVIYCRIERGSLPIISLQVGHTEPRPYIHRGLYSAIRRVLGLPVYRWRIPIPVAAEAHTYHLRAHAPTDTYLHAATFRSGPPTLLRAGANRKSAPEAVDGSVCMISPTWGSENLHAYTRDLGAHISPYTLDNFAHPSGLYVDVDFRIVPPAGGLSNLAYASYLLVLTTAISIFHDRFFVGDVSSLTPLVVGIPAIMSSWGISRIAREEMLRTTPILLFETISTAIYSLLAVGVAIAKLGSNSTVPASEKTSVFPFPGDWFQGHQWWLLVWLLSLTHWLMCTATYTRRAHRYSHALHSAAERTPLN